MVIELFKRDNKKLVDELIDVSKCSLKLAKTICDESGLSFEEELERNHNKNEIRGYHD